MRARFALSSSAVAAVACATLLAVSGAARASLPSSTTTVTAVAVGMDHTCALTGTGGVRCWGDNFHGAVGDGTSVERHYAVSVSGLAKGVRAIAAGEYYSCALTDAGGVKCWGYNHFGQLGDGSAVDRHAPVNVSGLTSGVQAIAAGATHACALTSAGAVKCWGENLHGELGDGTTVSHRKPVAVTGLGSGVAAITAGLEDTCVVTGAGAAKCWGENQYGKLGDGTATDRDVPVGVAGLGSGVAAISASDSEGHTCALMRSGVVRCWGNNAFGELGDGTVTTRVTAGGVSGLAGARAVAAGGFYTCAITSDSGMACWGDNSDGALGERTTNNRSTPGDVRGLTGGVAAIAAGLTHACAVTGGGALRCWGDNAFGELGDGTTNDHLAPVAVGFAGCVVPNVVGKGLAAATARIAKARCGVGALTKKLSPAKLKGRVVAEAPKPGRRLPAAGRVNLTVGKGPRLAGG